MTYHMRVSVREGRPEVEHSGEVPDGVYDITGTPGAHGPEPSVRFTRHENVVHPGAAGPRSEGRY